MRDEDKGHLESDRMDSVTMLPPPDGEELRLSFPKPNYVLRLKDLSPPADCPHLDGLVDAVHDL